MVEKIPSGLNTPETVKQTGSTASSRKAGDLSFQELLKQKEEQKLNISSHAKERMEDRNIKLEEEDLQKISEAVDRAAEKGVRSSLVLYGDVAMVASVTNRTIVTAVDENSSSEHVFTNIDGAVIVK